MPEHPAILLNNEAILKAPPLMLAWFEVHKRLLLWRQDRTPYRVWLAEVMLQQTTVQTATHYFELFLKKFPTLEDLAQAPLDDVLNLWQGLGYYSRARNLHKCAQIIVQDYEGQFPKTAKSLQGLPGIGPYTSAAISCIAFDAPCAVVDGNIERIISRVFAIKTPLPKSKPEILAYAEKLTPQTRSGDFAEAMMDLGATVCKPQNPKCSICPLLTLCQAQKLGLENTLPKKLKKKPRPQKNGIVYAIFAPDGSIFIRKRPEKGLLAQLWELPHVGWESQNLPMQIDGNSQGTQVGQVRHIFTHFSLTLDVRTLHISSKANPQQGIWEQPDNLLDYAFSTLMRKALAVALEASR